MRIRFSITRFNRMRKPTFHSFTQIDMQHSWNLLAVADPAVVTDFPLNPATQSNALIHSCPFGWRNVYSLIRGDARRRLIYQIGKSRSSSRFPFSETRARRNVIPRRDAIQSLYRSDHVLQWVHLRHCELPILPVHYSTSYTQRCWWRFIYMVAVGNRSRNWMTQWTTERTICE